MALSLTARVTLARFAERIEIGVVSALASTHQENADAAADRFDEFAAAIEADERLARSGQPPSERVAELAKFFAGVSPRMTLALYAAASARALLQVDDAERFCAEIAREDRGNA